MSSRTITTLIAMTIGFVMFLTVALPAISDSNDGRFFLRDGSRSMGGNLDLGGNTIKNIGAGLTFDSIDLDGGTIDGTVIGGIAPAAGTFTTGTITTADINGGAIDGTIIGGTTPAAGTFTTLIGTGGTIDGTIIGGSTPGAGTFTTLAVDNTTLDANILSTSAGDLTLDPAGSVNANNNSLLNVGADTNDWTSTAFATKSVMTVTNPSGQDNTIIAKSGATTRHAFFMADNSGGTDQLKLGVTRGSPDGNIPLDSTALIATGSGAPNMVFMTGAVPAVSMTLNGTTGGITVGSPTGGDKGAGTINAIGLYGDNTLLTDYVGDAYLGELDEDRLDFYDSISPDGTHDPANEFAERGNWVFDPLRYSNYFLEHGNLPNLPTEDEYVVGDDLSNGAYIQALMEVVEVLVLQNRDLAGRIDELESIIERD